MDDYSCSIEHPIYELISNKTRLKILRMIACEQNYGKRLADIFKLSPAAINKHIKDLTSENNSEHNLLREIDIHNDDHSVPNEYKGHTKVYSVNSELYLNFAIYPNFVHSHAFIDPLESDSKNEEEIKVTNTEFSFDKATNNFAKLYNDIQEMNEEIGDLENKMREIFIRKNQKMKTLNKAVLREPTLTFDERVILRIVLCQGPKCVTNLPEVLNQDQKEIDKTIEGLKKKGWFEKVDQDYL